MTSTSSPPPSAIVPMTPKINDCSWHRTCSWTGQPFMTVNNGCTHVGYVILTDDRLSSALTSPQNTLFRHDPTGFNDFYRVIMRIFRQGMVQISHHHSTGGNITVELMCEYCCRYVIVEDVNPRLGQHKHRAARSKGYIALVHFWVSVY